jgi:signal transduction histidine kinase/PAS domain-containing protein
VLGRPDRLAAVERARTLLASSSIPLDRIARLAAAGGHAPVGVISLLDAEREYLVATHGTPVTEVPASLSLCQHVVNTDLPLVIDDVSDEDAPQVRAAGIGSYAGFPVHLSGSAIGAVCVANPIAHRWTNGELSAVSDAASTVSALLAEQDALAPRPDGPAPQPDGSAPRPDGSAPRPDGSAPRPDGPAPRPDGSAPRPDGSAPRPDGPAPRPASARDGAAPSRGGATPSGEAILAVHDHPFLDALIGSLETAVVACDARGRLVMFNRQMREITGDLAADTPDAWPGREHVHHPDGRPMLTAELPLMRALAGEQIHSVPMLMRRPDHPDHHYLCTGRQLRAEDGAIVGAVMSMQEVTDLVRAARFKDCEVAVARVLDSDPPLAEAGRQVLQLVIEALQWPYAELWLRGADQPDSDDLRRWATAAVPDGSDLPPAPGHRLARLAGDRGCLIWARGGADGGGADGGGDPDDPGLRPTLAVPIRSAERTLGVITLFAEAVHDQREQLEDLLSGLAAHVGMFLERRRATQLAQALARSKDEYIGLVGHEMRTPLTSISAYTDLVLEDPALGDDLRPMLAVVQRNAATLRSIIANLLDLAALDSGHARINLSPTDLSDTVETVTQAAIERASAAGSAPQVTVDIAPGIRVPGDPPRLRQVVDNLLTNALKYTPADGAVVVRLRTDGATAVLDVADTGMGIPMTERTNLFSRFFRGKAAKAASIPGSGLGLAISRAIVDAHDGTLELVDRPGPGCTFRLTLPLRPSGEPADLESD